MHQQINECFESVLSKFKYGFKQEFSAQHCHLVMVEKLKKTETTKEFLMWFSLTSPKLLTVYLTVY